LHCYIGGVFLLIIVRSSALNILITGVEEALNVVKMMRLALSIFVLAVVFADISLTAQSLVCDAVGSVPIRRNLIRRILKKYIV